MMRHRVFGHSVPKQDAWGKVAGKTEYAIDRERPGMLFVRVARSSRPHANILEVGLEDVRRVDGVVGAWTWRDLPGSRYVGPRVKDEPVLCSRKVRRIGDPIVLIASKNERAARKAIQAVTVHYEDLPIVTSPEEALKTDSPQLHESGNVIFSRKVIRGDVDAALTECAHVIDNVYQTQMVEHAYLEPEAGLSYFENEVLTVELPTKHAHFEQIELARILNIEPERIRIICTPIGGYFGDKQCLSPGYYAAIVTFLTGLPAKMVYSRRESFEASTKRHPFTIRMISGADEEGRLQAIKVDITADTGAYASYGPSIMTRAVVHAAGPYRVDNVKIEGRVVYTNNPVCGAMRGFGAAQAVLAYETQMDLLARAVGKTPAEIRKLNFLVPGDKNAAGQTLSSSLGIRECMDEAEKIRASLPSHPRESDPRYFTGWGVASMLYGIGLTGLPNPGVVRITAAPGEIVHLFVGTGDGGQGASTTLAQIAAEALGVSSEQVEVISADTAVTPNSGTSTASRITYVVGRAVYEAAQNLIEEVRKAVSDKLSKEVIFKDGFFISKNGRTLFLEAVDAHLARPLEVEGKYDPLTQPLDKETGQGAPYATYSFALQEAQVSIDRETGKVDVLRIIAAHDVGRVVNPVNAEGQIHGGVLMGLGYGLLEDLVLSQGRIINPGFRAYLIPSILETPEFHIALIESPEPTGPFGAKGLGEPALLPTAPAIHNAVGAALNRHPCKIPITAEQVWKIVAS